MNSNNTNTNIKQDIVQQQTKLIAELREENARLQDTIDEQQTKIDYLRDVQEEYRNLRAAFSTGNVTYNQAMSTVNSARDVQMRINRAQREAEIEAQRAQAEEDRKQQILKKHPHIRNYFNEQKAKAEAVKTMMLEKAKAFYLLSREQAYEYASLATRPSQIAIKHLVNEITHGGDVAGGPPAVVTFECDHCKRIYNNLDSFIRHVYNNGDSHHDANLKRIEDEAREDIADAKREMEKEIFLAAQAKNTAALRAQAESQRAAQAQAKKSLPYVSK